VLCALPGSANLFFCALRLLVQPGAAAKAAAELLASGRGEQGEAPASQWPGKHGDHFGDFTDMVKAGQRKQGGDARPRPLQGAQEQERTNAFACLLLCALRSYSSAHLAILRFAAHSVCVRYTCSVTLLARRRASNAPEQMKIFGLRRACRAPAAFACLLACFCALPALLRLWR